MSGPVSPLFLSSSPHGWAGKSWEPAHLVWRSFPQRQLVLILKHGESGSLALGPGQAVILMEADFTFVCHRQMHMFGGLLVGFHYYSGSLLESFWHLLLSLYVQHRTGLPFTIASSFKIHLQHHFTSRGLVLGHLVLQVHLQAIL